MPRLSQAYQPSGLNSGYAVLEPPNYGIEGGLVNEAVGPYGIFKWKPQNLIAADPDPRIPAAQSILAPVGTFRQRIPLPSIFNPFSNGAAPLSQPVVYNPPGQASLAEGDLQQLWSGEG